ncbi:MAG: fibronectin type III domain-containing protein [Acidobacteriaceae bacterium]
MNMFVRFAVLVSICSLGCAHLSAQTPKAPIHVYSFKTAVDQVTLTWDAPPGSTTAASYNIYRMGKKVGATGQTSYKDTGLNMGEGYAYTVKAALASGVESPPSAAVDVVMPFTSGGLAQGGDGLCQPSSVSPRAQENVDAVKNMLPALLADADKYEAMVARMPENASSDFIRMGVRMLRSIPIALRCEPNAFAWSLPPSALQSIQEALPYLCRHASE